MFLLLQRVSDTQAQQAQIQAKLANDQHDIKLAVAQINARLDPLAGLPGEMAGIRIAIAQHDSRIATNSGHIGSLVSTVDALRIENHKRTGWEGLGGKALYLIGGATLTLIVGIALAYARPAKAVVPDLRIDQAANKKCWAAPAVSAPKSLFL